jgi:hypothetical protein
MLRITIPKQEFYDEVEGKFIYSDYIELDLEHSLVSVSKWESKFEKPFLAPGTKTTEEVLDYIRAMIVTPNVPLDIVSKFGPDDIERVNDYIESKQSATTFGMMPKATGRSETISSELVYYWMVTYNIPFECETWHLNRLFSLIRICNVKSTKQKKMSRGQLAARNRELNAQRRAALGTTG